MGEWDKISFGLSLAPVSLYENKVLLGWVEWDVGWYYWMRKVRWTEGTGSVFINGFNVGWVRPRFSTQARRHMILFFTNIGIWFFLTKPYFHTNSTWVEFGSSRACMNATFDQTLFCTRSTWVEFGPGRVYMNATFNQTLFLYKFHVGRVWLRSSLYERVFQPNLIFIQTRRGLSSAQVEFV